MKALKKLLSVSICVFMLVSAFSALADEYLVKHISERTVSPMLDISFVIHAAPFDIPTTPIYVTTDVLNIRREPSSESELVGTASYGDELQMISHEDDWYKIYYDGDSISYVAYVYDFFITDDPEEIVVSTVGNDLVEYAKGFLGKPYVYGSASGSSFDCSGFVMYVYQNYLGISLPHSSSSMSGYGKVIEGWDNLKSGDLVFFSTYSTSGVGHVGIYISDGNFIHASSGKGCVCISNLSESYYSNHYKGARRILE